jgi:D-glycero-beta-D-manno-heptose 1-phosphate adenylyltransferase
VTDPDDDGPPPVVAADIHRLARLEAHSEQPFVQPRAGLNVVNPDAPPRPRFRQAKPAAARVSAHRIRCLPRRTIHSLRFHKPGKTANLFLIHLTPAARGAYRSGMQPRDWTSKILGRAAMAVERERLRAAGRTVAMTNGCFDVLHAGHLNTLECARAQGDVLVVGMNADVSVRRLKGPHRPILPEAERARMMASLEVVDYVVLFEEKEVAPLIAEIRPDVLVKGGDWAHLVVGREIVESYGGKVVLAPIAEARSTTDIIARIRAVPGEASAP